MARDRTSFRQRDLAAALKAAKAAGLIAPIARIEVGRDGIRIIPAGSPEIVEADANDDYERRFNDVVRKMAEESAGPKGTRRKA